MKKKSIFNKTFESPYDQYKEHIGKTFTVLGSHKACKADPSAGKLYKIRLSDGVEIEAWPEEIIKEDMTWKK